MHADTTVQRPTILIVDDVADNLTLLHNLLRDDYRVKAAANGEQALKIAMGSTKPDLILLDIMMPVMDGYEVCRRLQADPSTHSIPVIFLTAKSDSADEKLGLDLGAVDYCTKPISAPIVLARIKLHLNLKAASDYLRVKAEGLALEVTRRTSELADLQYVTMIALASLAETRDNETGNHLRRTQHYVRALALELRQQPAFAELLDDPQVELLYKSAPLHDIGKVGIPDGILLKPGKLTMDEFEIMKTHTTLGRDAIENAEREIGHPVPFLKTAKEIAFSHQEKWNGSGYPQGLSGTDIPLSARLMALADVYDALISKRVYKEAMGHETARQIILEGSGTHFDPAIVEAFVSAQQQFQDIAQRFSDR